MSLNKVINTWRDLFEKTDHEINDFELAELIELSRHNKMVKATDFIVGDIKRNIKICQNYDLYVDHLYINKYLLKNKRTLSNINQSVALYPEIIEMLYSNHEFIIKYGYFHLANKRVHDYIFSKKNTIYFMMERGLLNRLVASHLTLDQAKILIKKVTDNNYKLIVTLMDVCAKEMIDEMPYSIKNNRVISYFSNLKNKESIKYIYERLKMIGIDFKSYVIEHQLYKKNYDYFLFNADPELHQKIRKTQESMRLLNMKPQELGLMLDSLSKEIEIHDLHIE